jgi:hypothetical protein
MKEITQGTIFLENIQGLLIYLKLKNGSNISLKELLEKDEQTLQYLLEDYEENHKSVLQNHIEQRHFRIKHHLATSFIEMAHRFEEASEQDFEKELEKTRIYYEDLISKLPTKYQELYSFGTVHNLLKELVGAAPVIGCEIPIPPVIGTISTSSVNACTLILETEEPIIFVEEDILSFIHLFSKVFVQCLSLEKKTEGRSSIILDKNDIRMNIKDNPEILFRFKDFLTAYILNGSPRESKPYLLKQDARYQLCTQIMMSAELFLVGHELGHVLANHLKTRRKLLFYNQEHDLKHENRNWEKEFEADKIGMYLSMKALEKYGWGDDMCYVGIEPFFTVYDIALRARKILKDGNEDISDEFRSHPPNNLRRQNTRLELKKITSAENFLNATYLPDLIHETMEYLWEESKDVFYKAYKKGLK